MSDFIKYLIEIENTEKGECMKCGKETIMYCYLANGYLCFEHYCEFFDSIKDENLRSTKTD